VAAPKISISGVQVVVIWLFSPSFNKLKVRGFAEINYKEEAQHLSPFQHGVP
jgi:hypothetical protein